MCGSTVESASPTPSRAAPVLSSQASSLRFLAEQGFDFNRWVRDGIGYMTATERDARLAELKHATDSKQARLVRTSNKYRTASNTVAVPCRVCSFCQRCCVRISFLACNHAASDAGRVKNLVAQGTIGVTPVRFVTGAGANCGVQGAGRCVCGSAGARGHGVAPGWDPNPSHTSLFPTAAAPSSIGCSVVCSVQCGANDRQHHVRKSAGMSVVADWI